MGDQGVSDNPFAEPDDDDRTMIMQRPAFAPASAPADARPEREPVAHESFGDIAFAGASPIVDAAAPLLSLIARLRNVLSVPDPASLRERTMLEIRGYEQALRDRKVPAELIRTSHYALCASLDDVVQNTPWGSHGPWADASLIATFHREVRSGERFFSLLTRLTQNAGRFLPVIELMYLCMSLGMQGRYRLSPRGPAELDRVREETYLIILRQRGAAEAALSPHWQGAAKSFRPPRFEPPVWLAALVAAGLLGLAYTLVALGLNTSSDRSFEHALALPPESMPAIVRPRPPEPLAPVPQPEGGRTQLAGFLAPEIRQGLVSVVGTEAAPIIRLQSAGMFASGSAVIEPAVMPVLDRIADALRTRPGPVRIAGYTDAQPIHTVAFPSNYQLSLARARAAGQVLGAIGASRISAEGRADADPIGPNTTPAGRQLNRRIEITVGEPETP